MLNVIPAADDCVHDAAGTLENLWQRFETKGSLTGHWPYLDRLLGSFCNSTW